MKNKIITSIIVTAIALTITGCGNKNDSSKTIADPRAVLNGAEENPNSSTSTTTKTATTKKPAAPIAAKPGEKVAPNSTPWRVVSEISATCADALKPFRDFEKKYPGGLLREANATKAETDAMNKAMALVQSNKKVCSEKDFNLWYTEEYLGWSRSNK